MSYTLPEMTLTVCTPGLVVLGLVAYALCGLITFALTDWLFCRNYVLVRVNGNPTWLVGLTWPLSLCVTLWLAVVLLSDHLTGDRK